MHPVKHLFEDIYRNYWGISPATEQPERRRPSAKRNRDLLPETGRIKPRVISDGAGFLARQDRCRTSAEAAITSQPAMSKVPPIGADIGNSRDPTKSRASRSPQNRTSPTSSTRLPIRKIRFAPARPTAKNTGACMSRKDAAVPTNAPPRCAEAADSATPAAGNAAGENEDARAVCWC